jgi:hypothetical protein
MDFTETEAYRRAFSEFAMSRSLHVYFTPGTTYIVPIRDDDLAGTIQPVTDGQPRAMTDDERGGVLGWLCSRPEVSFLHVPRHRAGSCSSADARVSVALLPMHPKSSKASVDRSAAPTQCGSGAGYGR